MNDQVLQRALPEIRERIGTFFAHQRLPGLAAGIVSGRQLVWFQGWGSADRETGRPLDQDTLFRVASITKTFTTTAILQLRDAGRLSLDDPLRRHIPEFGSTQSNVSMQHVTLRRMLSHHAGLTTEAPLPCWDALAFPSRDELLQSLPRMEVVIPPESAFKYSNLAFGLLGEVVARVSGRPYCEYLESEILRPLGLKSTTFELSSEQRQRLAVGYSPGQQPDDMQPAPYIAMNGLAACGGLYSSVADLARWMRLQLLGGQEEPDSRLLAPDTIEESHRPQYLEADWSVGYCLGWRANRFGDRVYHGHGGGVYGFASQILFDKRHKWGVICLANVWPRAGLVELAGQLLDVIVTENAAAAPHAGTADSAPGGLRELLGTYSAGPGIMLQVAYRQGCLRLAAPPGCDYFLHVPAALEESGRPREFVVRGGRGSGEKVVFEPPSEKEPQRFELGGFVYRRDDAC